MKGFPTVKKIMIPAAALLVATTLALADGPATRPAGGPSTRPAGQNRVSLERLMERMEESYKVIEEQVSDPAKSDSTLKALGEMQQATMASKLVIPGRINRLADPEKAKALADYRQFFITLLRLEIDLEEQVAAGDLKAAHATMEKIEDVENKGHEEFRKKKAK